MKIITKKNESSDSIIKRLKSNLIKSGLLKSIKNKMYHIKPTKKKKLKTLNKIIKLQKNIKKNYINFN